MRPSAAVALVAVVAGCGGDGTRPPPVMKVEVPATALATIPAALASASPAAATIIIAKVMMAIT